MRNLAEIWCRTMHGSPMWPSHGHYECRTCGREYPVAWEHDVTNTPWRHENVVDRSIRLDRRSSAHAAQMIRPS